MTTRQLEEAEAAAKYLRECTAIDEGNINSEFIRLPTDMVDWGVRFAEAKSAHLLLKAKRGHVYALARSRARDILGKQSGGARVTEAMVEDRAELDSAWKEHQEQEVHAEVRVIRLRAILDAIDCKREMVVSLGATLRDENRASGAYVSDNPNRGHRGPPLGAGYMTSRDGE